MRPNKEKINSKKVSCIDRAMSMLSRRSYAEGELRCKLCEKGYSQGEVDDALSKLHSYGFIDDNRFAYERVRYRVEISHWGKQRIFTELKQKKVDDVVMQKQFQAYFEQEAEKSLQDNAYELLMKKYGPWNPNMEDTSAAYDIRISQRKEIEKEKSRRLNFLMRRGFSMNEALDALHRTSILL